MTPLETQLAEALGQLRAEMAFVMSLIYGHEPPENIVNVVRAARDKSATALAEYYRQLEQEQPKAPY